MATDPGFVHLHVHSAYSLLEGALPISKLAEFAKADKQPALGLTDTDNMFGALEFAEKLSGYGIQPITGCALAVDFGDEARDPRLAGRARPFPRIVLLAAREEGYRNLMQLNSRAFMETEFEREAASEAFLARRPDRWPDRAHRRAGRAARCGDCRRPDRTGGNPLRGVAEIVWRPALHRTAAPRHAR